MLRNSIALITKFIDRREVKSVQWVETSSMLADVLTKKGGNYFWLKRVLTRNEMYEESKEEKN